MGVRSTVRSTIHVVIAECECGAVVTNLTVLLFIPSGVSNVLSVMQAAAGRFSFVNEFMRVTVPYFL